MLAILFAGFGGGNEATNVNTGAIGGGYGPQTFIAEYVAEHDPDLAPAPYRLIEATPTPAAIATTVTVVAASRSEPVENCPAVIGETFGEHAPAACAVAWCESSFDPHAVGDGGRSLGWFQLWTGWAAWYGVQVDALFDPATNAAVARAVFEHRGRWGGAGGWTCADLLGIW